MTCSVEGCLNVVDKGRMICRRHYHETLPDKFCHWTDCNKLCHQRGRFCTSHSNLLTRHKITETKWYSILKFQKYLCAFCYAPFTSETRMSVDHNRECCPNSTSCGNCIRGIIHQECNVIEGYVRALQNKVGVIPLFREIEVYQSKKCYSFNDQGEVDALIR